MTIAFNKTKEPYGWLGNMSAHTIKYDNRTWRTAEALFQALRFNDEKIRLEIWKENSPLIAKFRAKANADKMVVKPLSSQDIDNMRHVLKLKLEQHPYLKAQLLATGDQNIIEDCTARKASPWGARLINNQWVGDNILGKLWEEIRNTMRQSSEAVQKYQSS